MNLHSQVYAGGNTGVARLHQGVASFGVNTTLTGTYRCIPGSLPCAFGRRGSLYLELRTTGFVGGASFARGDCDLFALPANPSLPVGTTIRGSYDCGVDNGRFTAKRRR